MDIHVWIFLGIASREGAIWFNDYFRQETRTEDAGREMMLSSYQTGSGFQELRMTLLGFLFERSYREDLSPRSRCTF